MLPRVLVLSGSRDASSPTSRLAQEAARLLALADLDVTLVSLADLDLPLFDAEAASGQSNLPADRLATRIAGSDALLLVCREAAGALAADLKNLIEWTGLGGGRALSADSPYAELDIWLAAQGSGDRAFHAARSSLVELGGRVADETLCLTVQRDGEPLPVGTDGGGEEQDALVRFLDTMRRALEG